MGLSLSGSARGSCWVVLIFAVISGVTEVKGQLTWLQLHDGSVCNETMPCPSTRRDAVLSYDAIRNQLILFGGNPGPMDDTWLYNVTSNEWRELNSTGTLHPPARYAAVGGISSDYFYVATGRGADNAFYNDVWRFDIGRETWVSLAPVSRWRENANSSQPYAPPGRYFASGGIYVNGTRLYVSLGANDRVRTGDTFAFDIISNTWFKEDGGCSQYDPRCPHPRYLQSGVVTNKEQFVIFSGCLSGQGTAGPCPSHDAWHYDGQMKKWSQLDNCPAPRLYSTMALLPEGQDGKRYVVMYGGQTDTATVIQVADLAADEVAVLDLHTAAWTLRRTTSMNNMTEEVPGRRMSAAMTTGSHGIFLFGGSSIYGVNKNDLWLLLGNTTDADLSPVLPCSKITITVITVHGILMAIAFGLFLPLGALLMRHFRQIYAHVALQILGLCCAIAGLALGVVSVSSSHFCFVHAIVGIIALSLLVLQPVSAFLRPKEDPEERKYRSVWQMVHRCGGFLSVILSLINGSLGIFLSVAALPVVIAWHTWLGFLLLLFLVGEVVQHLLRQRQKRNRSHQMSNAGSRRLDAGVINGWDKGDSTYVNATTESIRL